MRNVLTKRPRTNPTVIELPNGAIIRFLSGENPDKLYGEDVFAAVIDEATRCREEAWHAIRSTLTKTRAQVRMIANVTDRSNWFYRVCRRAQDGEPEYAHSVITAKDAVAAGVLDPAEIEQARRDLPEHVYGALYECIAPPGGVNPFGTEEEIRACIAELDKHKDELLWGWDLARDRNYTAGIGLTPEGRTAEFEHWHGISWHDQITRIVSCVGDNIALADATGPGSGPVEEMQRESNGVIQPFIFTGQSKQQIMEGLAVKIQRNDISYPDGPIVNELLHMEYELTRTGIRYAAPEGLHDDCVDALALANFLRQTQAAHGIDATIV